MVERFYQGDALLELADLPGSDARDAVPQDDIEELRAAFLRSPWATRIPHSQEVPFSMLLGELPVRGRIDAVFADDDGGWTVVDWKTGPPPDRPQIWPRYRCSWPSTGWPGPL